MRRWRKPVGNRHETSWGKWRTILRASVNENVKEQCERPVLGGGLRVLGTECKAAEWQRGKAWRGKVERERSESRAAPGRRGKLRGLRRDLRFSLPILFLAHVQRLRRTSLRGKTKEQCVLLGFLTLTRKAIWLHQEHEKVCCHILLSPLGSLAAHSPWAGARPRWTRLGLAVRSSEPHVPNGLPAG